MVNVVFSYFLLSPPRRMVVLTCASGKFIASYQARYIAVRERACEKKTTGPSTRATAHRAALHGCQRGRSLVSEAS